MYSVVIFQPATSMNVQDIESISKAEARTATWSCQGLVSNQIGQN